MDVFPFESEVGRHLLMVDGSRIYDVDDETFALAHADPRRAAAFVDAGSGAPPFIDHRPPSLPPLHALSLNVAQTCNLACGYCYADKGRFGGRASFMSEETAMAAVALLLEEAAPSGSAVLGFMGGEPFQNRCLVHAVTRRAHALAERRGVRLRFSVTTNATLLTDEDCDLLSSFPFTVAVSLDGPEAVNDRQRPDRKGSGSWRRAIEGLRRLQRHGAAHVSVRATATPRTGRLLPILEELIGLGVGEVGFAPVLVSPDPALAFSEDDFAVFLQQMVECGEAAKAAILARQPFPFSNFETGLLEIARGAHRPYSCGAGAGYGSVASDGKLFACHRAIGDEAFQIGDVASGPDRHARTAFLADRHVLRQEPCRMCWARFLCGGGCHHEVAARGRPGCDFVRGWLRFLLAAYVEIGESAPDYLADPATFFSSEDR